jgi:hypothetical protein
MALRAHEKPAPTRKSAKVGETVVFAARLENTGPETETVLLAVEDLKEGALARPVGFAFVFRPATAPLPGKTRTRVEFAWRAALPEGKTAFTFRGRLVLRRPDGGVDVASAPLDLYVSGS